MQFFLSLRFGVLCTSSSGLTCYWLNIFFRNVFQKSIFAYVLRGVLLLWSDLSLSMASRNRLLSRLLSWDTIWLWFQFISWVQFWLCLARPPSPVFILLSADSTFPRCVSSCVSTPKRSQRKNCISNSQKTTGTNQYITKCEKVSNKILEPGTGTE